MSKQVLISDTSALIILSKLDKLFLLQELFDDIIITSIVQREFGEELPNWIKIQNPLESSTSKLLNIQLDPGEASAIALALEKDNNPLLLIDERKGRKIAQQLNLRTMGTLGVLLLAKKAGHLLYVKPILEEMINLDFRISDDLIQSILKLAKE